MGKKFRNKQIQEGANGEAVYVREEYEEAAPEAVEEPKIEFDGWYASRRDAIPAIHKKEILKADFKGRKVPMIATVAEFDEALKKYGVKLV